MTFLLSVPVDMRVKMLEREQNWHRLRSVQLAGIVVSVVSGIAMAAAGAGVYSLIVPGLLSSTLMMMDLFIVCGWRPQWQWSYVGYRDTLRFGFHRAGSNAMNSGRTLVQNGLITHNAQFAGLGVFSRADGLANMFCRRIAQQVTGALYPVVTRIDAQSDQFRRISRLVLSSVAWVVVPIAVYLSFQAASLVHVLYGQKWLAVAPLLPLAVGCGLASSIGATAYSLLLANDQSRLCLRSDTAAFLIALLPMVVLIPLGLRPYLTGALAAQSAIAAILVGMLIRTRGLPLDGLLTALTPPAISATVAAAGMWMIASSITAPVAEIARLFITWLIFSVVYVLTLRLVFRTALTEIVAYLPAGKRIGRVLCL
jgi:O-antigen/teichoic acid export membrane protein